MLPAMGGKILAYDDLIHQIYNAIDEPHTWKDVLANIARELNSTHIFLAARAGVDQQPFAFVESGFDDGHFDLYQQYFYQIDEWTQGVAKFAPNQFHSSHYVVDDKAFVKSEIYNDFARPGGIRHGMGCLMLDEEEGMMAEVGIMRGLGTDFYDEPTRLAANSLIKHVQQSLAISKKMQALGARHGDFQQLLDATRAAVFICNDAGVMLEANQLAQELLSASRILKLGSLKQLYFLDRDAQLQFESLKLQMGLIISGANDFSFSLQSGAIRYRVKLQPWMHSQIHALGVAKIPALMLSIRPMRGEIKPDAQDLMAIYRFTKAESEVAVLICRGLTPAEISVMRNTSLMTVRQQLKTCMHKALVHSQAELVAKLLSFTAG